MQAGFIRFERGAMAITDDRARELADVLPEGLSFEGSRGRLLGLVELMRALTDEGERYQPARRRVQGGPVRGRFQEPSLDSMT